MPSQKHTRYKLLLDEGLPPKENYFKTNNYHNVKHIKHDFKKGGAIDPLVYSLAADDNRLPIVFNTKDFKPLIKASSISVISLSTNLSNYQADLKICKALRSLKPSQLKGHIISISNSGINIEKTEGK